MSERKTATGSPHRSWASRSNTSPAHLLLPYPFAYSSSTGRTALMARMSDSSSKVLGSTYAATATVDR
ncbi:Uncharacterised protein [Mycobacteroides abscessus subsp. bolletii]|nr:Uncharacterised protein [Mycobacteroides abscessus subsp. bolletii]